MWSDIKALVLRLRTSLLFTPLLFAIGGLLLSFVTVYLDRSGAASGLIKMLPAGGIDEEGARSVLSTIASGMLSVTSIVISLTFVALTMMSSQLGPRLLLFFMRDRTTKIVLGIFVATILYSLVSMASVGAKGDATFAPHLSFVTAIVLAVLSLGAMIYFVDHIAHSIQADAVVANLARACDDAIEQGLRERREDDPGSQEIEGFLQRFSDSDHQWTASSSGYLATLDYDAVVKAARQHDAIVKLFFRVNSFVYEGQVIAVFRCGDDRAAALREALQATIAMSERRTPAQQINFEMSALSEVALRALSPGINDPFTAAACIDYLGNTLSRIARAAPKLRLLSDEDGRHRVIRPANDLPFFLYQCIAPIIEAADGSPVAIDSLIRTLNRLDQLAGREQDREAIARQKTALKEVTEKTLHHPGERKRLLACLETDPSPVPPV